MNSRFKFWWKYIDKSFSYWAALSSQLSLNSCSVVRLTTGHGSWENSHTNCRLSALIQLLFSFDQDSRVEKTLIRALTCQLSSIVSCNSCSRLTKTWELRKLSYKLSRVSFHQLSCNSCSRLTRTWELRSLIQTLACQLSSTLMQLLFSFEQEMRVKKTLIQKKLIF